MVANAFGSALGGMTTNAAGLTDPGGAAGAASAAAWLFGLYMLAPVLAGLVIRRLRLVGSDGGGVTTLASSAACSM